MTGEAAAFGRPASQPLRPVVPVSSLSTASLWFAVFLSGFVIREPAPYELYMVMLTAIWMLFGLRLRAETGPLIVCMMLYMAGGIAAIPFAREMGDAIIYIAVTGFLAVTAIFYAAILADDPQRFRTIQNAYTGTAVIAALIGIAGYFHLFPGADYFTLYDRARGTFQDPNVFGPFLVLPAILLIQSLLREPLRNNLLALSALPILMLAIFLSFSRGAWVVVFLASVMVYLLALITEQNNARRIRMIAIGCLGVFALLAMLAVALSFDAVSSMFEQRAKLVQHYDGARLGRFARFAIGFQMMMEHPLGIGALEFNKYFPEDEHNVYLKGFTTHGWLGGITYIVMAVWTVCALTPLLFKKRPWTVFAQGVFAVFVAHLVLSIVIDTDHWRHMYMLYGLAWGLIAADKIEHKRLQRAQPSAP